MPETKPWKLYAGPTSTPTPPPRSGPWDEYKTPVNEDSFNKTAALRGFTENAVPLGYAPQLAGASNVAINSLAGLLGKEDSPAEVNAKLRAQGFTGDLQDSPYLEGRDQYIADTEAMKKEAPGSYYSGAVPGFAAQIAATGGAGRALGALKPAAAGASMAQKAEAGLNLAKAPSYLSSALSGLGKGAAMGAGYGALSNPGDVPGEITPLQIQDRFKNALIGGAVGAPIGAIGGVLGNLASRGQKLEQNISALNKGYPVEAQSRAALDDASEALQRKIGQVESDIVAPQLKAAGNIQMDPEKLKGLNYLDDMAQTRNFDDFYNKYRNTSVDPMDIVRGVKTPPAPVDVPASEVRELVKGLSKAANYTEPNTLQGAPTASNKAAENLGNILRGQLKDKGVTGLQREAELFAPKNVIESGRAGRDPLGWMKSASIPLTPQQSAVSLLAEKEGLPGLQNLSKGIKEARPFTTNPSLSEAAGSGLTDKAINLLKTLAVRAPGKLGQLVEESPALQKLLQGGGLGLYQAPSNVMRK